MAGILEDSPRFDYSGGASCPSLLLEPSRTNLVEYSEYIEGNTSQGFTNATKEGFTESPEGLNNAYEINVITPNENAAYDLGRFNTTIGADYTYSVYLKSRGTFDARIYAARGTTETKDIVLTSEWQRFDLTFTSDNADKDLIVGFGDFNFANPAQTISIYGLQFENATYKTSYIPNHSGGSVTREFDYSIVESLGYSSTCTFYYEFNTTTGRESSSPFAEVGKDTSNKFYIKGSSANNPQFQVQGNGIFTGNISPTNEVSGTNRIAVQWSSGVGVVFCNGVKLSGTLTNSNTSESIDFIKIKGDGTFHDSKQLLFFEQALSDSECITLTS